MSIKNVKLREAISHFYDDYHRYRVRVPNTWMRTTYWPAFHGTTLELGGGTLWPQREDYMVVDLSFAAPQKACAAGIPAAVSDGTQLPFADNSFNTVACYDVIEHVIDPAAFIAEMCRVANKRVVVAGPNWIGDHPGGMS